MPQYSQMRTRIIESAKQTNAPEAMHNPKMTWHNFIEQQTLAAHLMHVGIRMLELIRRFSACGSPKHSTISEHSCYGATSTLVCYM